MGTSSLQALDRTSQTKMKSTFLLAFCLCVANAIPRVPLYSRDVLNFEKSRASKNIVQLAEELELNTLVELVKLAGLDEALSGEGPFTLFAPSDHAFDLLPFEIRQYLASNITALQEVLSYHVVPGTVLSKDLSNELLADTLLKGAQIRINIYTHENETVVTATGAPVNLKMVDQMASNGVIHVIEKVVWPIPMGSIIDVTSTAKELSTLQVALTTAGLNDTLKADGNFTLFAPSDLAFAKIPTDELNSLLKNKKKLTEVLTFHVVGMTQYSMGLYDDEMLKTLQGTSITINIKEGRVTVTGGDVISGVIRPDIPVTNGVIHVIDTVLMPSD